MSPHDDFADFDVAEWITSQKRYSRRLDVRLRSWWAKFWCGFWYDHYPVRGGHYPDRDGTVYWYECRCGENSGSN